MQQLGGIPIVHFLATTSMLALLALVQDIGMTGIWPISNFVLLKITI